MDPVIGSVDGDERCTEITQGWFTGESEMLFGHHHPYPLPVLQFGQARNTLVIAAGAPCRLLGHLDFSDQVAGCRIPPGERDAGRFPDQAPSAVAPDEIVRPKRRTVGERDVDAGVVLRKPRHLPSAIDRHRQLADPTGQDALDLGLPQGEPVVVPRGKVADVQRDPSEARDLRHLPLRQEAISEATLIELLDGACVQTARARAGEALAGAPLDNGHVNPRQRQLPRQHQSRRTAAGDHHRVLGHTPLPSGTPRSTWRDHRHRHANPRKRR